jgi:hypothetical protein
MNTKVLLMLIPVLLIFTGCSSVTEPQKPQVAARPVQPKTPPAKVAKKPLPPAKSSQSVPGSSTYAIEPPKTDFKIEPNLPTFRIDPLAPPVETPTPAPAAPGAPVAPTPGQPISSTTGTPTIPSQSIPSSSAPAVPAYVTEEARIPSGTPPAVLALISESDKSRSVGELDAAVIAMERALRIDTRNATLTYKLAQLRIKQNKPQLAEELAGKSALLAGSDLDLKRKSWLLIAEARRMQQNLQGAKEAKHKAESFFGR